MNSIIRPTHSGNNSQQQCRWHAFSTAAELERHAAQAVMEYAQQAIQQRGAFHLVLAGGNTPRNVYTLLSNLSANWHLWHIYFGDERCLPADHAERNSLMATQTWLNHVSIPAGQIHPIPAELGAEAAALAYAQTLSPVTLFDLVLLGLGEDGHTASLFPQHDWGEAADAPDVLAVHDAPKPPPDRVSLSAHRLSQTRQLLFLVSGTSKKSAIAAWRAGQHIPAANLAPASGVDIYLEQGLLSPAA